MDSNRILIVDDDPDILRILADNLELDGYRVSAVSTGREALQAFKQESYDLIVLDLTLPDIDGIQVCLDIREKSDLPIIVLTARDRVPEKVLGLEAGADDYIVKPFDYLELAARIRACLRRRRFSSIHTDVLELGDLKIDTNRNLL
ncbi:MAG: response regulator, partial [Deltaproteobacteria bacterium]|nr:response regulator [Deltaproteobacteria bacterium]